jgi:hypothetical protein
MGVNLRNLVLDGVECIVMSLGYPYYELYDCMIALRWVGWV